MPNKNPFKIALEVRKGNLDENVLYGAAKQIYKDATLTNEMLESYTIKPETKKNNTTQQTHSNFKY